MCAMRNVKLLNRVCATSFWSLTTLSEADASFPSCSALTINRHLTSHTRTGNSGYVHLTEPIFNLSKSHYGKFKIASQRNHLCLCWGIRSKGNINCKQNARSQRPDKCLDLVPLQFPSAVSILVFVRRYHDRKAVKNNLIVLIMNHKAASKDSSHRLKPMQLPPFVYLHAPSLMDSNSHS
jgi:hypothetical protein